MSQSKSTVYYAKRKDQKDALSSQIRLEIIGQFTSPGGMSIAEVAERMGRPASSLYYHFRLLEQVGLLRRIGTRRRGKRHEAIFEPVAPKIALDARGLSRDDIRVVRKTLASAFRMAERDLEAALDSGTARAEGPHRNFYASRLHFRVTPSVLAEINSHVRAIERVLLRQARRKKLPPDADQYCSLTVALMPLRGRDSSRD